MHQKKVDHILPLVNIVGLGYVSSELPSHGASVAKLTSHYEAISTILVGAIDVLKTYRLGSIVR